MKTIQSLWAMAVTTLLVASVHGQSQQGQQKIKFLPHPSIPTNLLADSSCFQFNKVPKVLLDGSSALTCSQIADNNTALRRDR